MLSTKVNQRISKTNIKLRMDEFKTHFTYYLTVAPKRRERI